MSIELTKEEARLLKKYQRGEFQHFTAPEEEQQIFSGVIDKAEKLCDEMEAWDEVEGDLISWFAKYVDEQE